MLAKHSLKYRSYNENNGAYYSCNFNRGHFLRIPSLSTGRHVYLDTNSPQFGYRSEISSRDPGLLVWVILLLAHKVIICLDHGHFIIMKRASIQEILYSRDVHVAICDLLP